MLQCHFSRRVFPLDWGWSIPCRTNYHAGCFRLGAPFYTRLANNGGLFLTKAMGAVLPLFICECCTVRQVLGRELTYTPRDFGLLAMERMRLIDMIHNWAPSTLNNYKGRLKIIQDFGQQYRCPVLLTPTLVAPPVSKAIPLMWAQ